jgi:flavorubredoxin
MPEISSRLTSPVSVSDPPVEVIPGRLHALGGTVVLDGKVSWSPANGRQQPALGYLVLGADVPILIDAGLKVHAAAFREQMRSLLAPGSRLSIFLTRAEYDCIGALDLIAQDYQIERIYTGGTQNPFDAFGEVTKFSSSWDERVQLGRQAAGHSQILESADGLEVLTPALRILATYWVYLARIKTLFTSDVFGHTSLPLPGSSWITEAGGDDVDTADTVREHLACRYFWLPRANTTALRSNLSSVFESHDVEVIAPTHGRVIRGRSAVRRHYELLQQVLADIGLA